MRKKRFFTRDNSFVAATLYVTVFVVVAMLVVGLLLKDMTSQVQDSVVKELSDRRFSELRGELDHSLQVVDMAALTLSRDGFEVLNKERLFKSMHPQVEAVRVTENMGDYLDRPTITLNNSSTAEGLFCLSRSFRYKGVSYLLSADVSLLSYYDYSTSQAPEMSYVTLLSKRGVVAMHPDSARLGVLCDDAQRAIVARVLESGEAYRCSVTSDFLQIPTVRRYYPLTLGGERWVAVIGVPTLITQGMQREFIGYVVILALVMVLFVVALLRLLREQWRREAQRRRVAEQESAALQLQQVLNQINPHFLFNSLNSLYSLISHDAALSRRFVIELSGLYRYVLDQSKQPLALLEREVEVMQKYLFLQKIRFGDQIDVEVDVQQCYMSCYIPTMSLQTLLENAIKHNVISEQNPLRVSVYVQGDVLVVENRYAPRKNSEHKSFGIGLKGLDSIYDYYGDKSTSCGVEDGMFRCSLPLLKTPKD